MIRRQFAVFGGAACSWSISYCIGVNGKSSVEII